MNSEFKDLFPKYIFESDCYCLDCYKSNSRLYLCPLTIITRPNFYEQPHFVLYNYSLLSPSFFTPSVTLSAWKPLSVGGCSISYFILHVGPRGFSSFSIAFCVSLLFSFLPLPRHLHSTLKPIVSPFLVNAIYLSLSPGVFRSCPFLPPRDNRARSGGPQFFSPPLRRFSSRSSRDFSVY